MIAYRWVSVEEYGLLLSGKQVRGKCALRGTRQGHAHQARPVVCFFTGLVDVDGLGEMVGIPTWPGRYLVKVDIPDEAIVSRAWGRYAGLAAEEVCTASYSGSELLESADADHPLMQEWSGVGNPDDHWCQQWCTDTDIVSLITPW